VFRPHGTWVGLTALPGLQDIFPAEGTQNSEANDEGAIGTHVAMHVRVDH
jgi:hypothetical protein